MNSCRKWSILNDKRNLDILTHFNALNINKKKIVQSPTNTNNINK